MLPYTLPENHRVTDIAPKIKYGSETGEQDTTGQGVPQWTVTVKLIWQDSEGDPTSQSIRMTVPSRTELPPVVGQQIVTEGLEIGTMNNGTTFFRAASIAPKARSQAEK